MRAQALDGSATGVLETVRRLGFLQIDVVQPVERPQHLVLYSRLGPGHDRAELDRLLWEERALFEWECVHLPARGRTRSSARGSATSPLAAHEAERWVREFLTENRAFRRYVLRELERTGRCSPVTSRIARRASGAITWWGPRMVGLMLLSLHLYGEITVVGRRSGERLWDHLALVAGDGDDLGAEGGTDPRGAAAPPRGCGS